MFRFRRVNIDGKSITETYAANEAVKPGELVKLAEGKFAKAALADVGKAQLFIVTRHSMKAKPLLMKLLKTQPLLLHSSMSHCMHRYAG